MQSINIMKLEKYAMHKYIGVIIMDEDEKNNLENRIRGMKSAEFARVQG